MIVTWTGHRPDKLNHEWEGIGPWSDALRIYVGDYLERCKAKMSVSGLALGLDLLAAEETIKRDLKLIAAAPCDNHFKGWNDQNLERLERIRSYPKCRFIVVCPGPYEKWKMQARNVWMVNKGNGVSGIFDGSRGGTYNCLEYAQRRLREKAIQFVDVMDPRKLMGFAA